MHHLLTAFQKLMVYKLDVVMSIYNLLEHSKNYRKTTGSLWNYYSDKPGNPVSLKSESLKYKTGVVGKTPEDNDLLTNAKVVILLKHLSNFWRALKITLINCEVKLILTWFKICFLADMAVNADADPAIVAPSGATLKIIDTKLYVPVVTLSKENYIKLLEKLKT